MRQTAVDGSESIRAVLSPRLSLGQRTIILHLAFCPPFAQTPEIEFEQESGPAARIKLGQSLPYGARLDVKLQSPADDSTTLAIRLLATARLES
jgi:hypothetical protein